MIYYNGVYLLIRNVLIYKYLYIIIKTRQFIRTNFEKTVPSGFRRDGYLK